jgi:hypothetical protein
MLGGERRGESKHAKDAARLEAEHSEAKNSEARHDVVPPAELSTLIVAGPRVVDTRVCEKEKGWRSGSFWAIIRQEHVRTTEHAGHRSWRAACSQLEMDRFKTRMI